MNNLLNNANILDTIMNNEMHNVQTLTAIINNAMHNAMHSASANASTMQ